MKYLHDGEGQDSLRSGAIEMSNTVLEIENELAKVELQLTPLLSQRTALQVQLRTVKAGEFIRFNKIEVEDVQLSSGEGMPCFHVIHQFAEWIKKQPVQKRFCEWNTRIYPTADLLHNNRMIETGVELDDLKRSASQ